MQISPRTLIRATAAAALRPDPELTVSQWADKHRQLSAEGSVEAGQWRTSRTPYGREIMDELSPSSPTQRIVVMKGARIGMTEFGNNWLGYVMHHAPAPILMVYPTFDIAKRVSKVRVSHMIESSPALRDRVAEPRSRDASNTILYKEFPGGQLVMIGAKSGNSLREMTVRDLFLDEVDGYDSEILGEGNTVSLLERRTVTFRHRRKIFMVSTPKEKGASLIETEFLRGDRRRYLLPCPACGHLDYLTWSGRDWLHDEEGGTVHHSIGYDDDNPETAHMVCSSCSERIEERWKTWMLNEANGARWKPQAVSTDPFTKSYHLSSLYAPLGFESWKDCVADWIAAKKDPSKLRVVVNQTFGETYEDRSERSPSADSLRDRPRIDAGVVPMGVGILTCGVDVHGDRLEAQVEGWGAQEENWTIEWRAFIGDTLKPEVWWELDKYLRQRFQHVNGHALKIDRTAVDAGYRSDEVYKFTKPRQAMGVYAVKGINEVGKPIVGRASRAPRYNALLFPICTDAIKDRIMARLRIRAPGPGYMHFSRDLDDEWFDQLTSERKIRHKRGRRIVEEWTKQRERNEALDLKGYNLVALYIAGKEAIMDLGRRAARYSTKLDPAAIAAAAAPRGPAAPAIRRRPGSWMNRWKR